MNDRERGYRALFPKKSIIGMVHLFGKGSHHKFVRALEEIAIYEEEGVDGVIVEDYCPSATAFDIHRLFEHINGTKNRSDFNIKLGVNYLGDSALSLDFARRHGLDFIQIDSLDPYSPSIELGQFREMMRSPEYSEIVVLGGADFKGHQRPDGQISQGELDRVIELSHAVVTSGSSTGGATPIEKLKQFREQMGSHPLVVGSGVTPSSAYPQLQVADAAIVGSYFKEDGIDSKIKPERIREVLQQRDWVDPRE